MEGCGFRDRTPQFHELNTTILGASFDTPGANLAFRQKFDLPYSLLCDTTRTLGLQYGACTDRDARHPARISYVIDAVGHIRNVYPQVNARTHFDDVLRDLGGDPPRRGLLQRLLGR